MKLILASASPRRRDLLTMIGASFEIVVSDADETVDPCLSPAQLVESLAHKKAACVKRGKTDCCVIGADTIVVLEGEILGKPASFDDAVSTLKRLRSRTHTVYTGLAVLTDTRSIITHQATYVTFSNMTDDQIFRYLNTGEPMDKAGAYGLQGIGGVFVEKVEGCYSTVIGLPLPKLFAALEELGISLF